MDREGFGMFCKQISKQFSNIVFISKQFSKFANIMVVVFNSNKNKEGRIYYKTIQARRENNLHQIILDLTKTCKVINA
jgi:hypothetical protein